MHPKDLLLPLLAALWALCTLVFNGTKELNTIRDRILYPNDAGFFAELKHRKLLARNDWRPLLELLIFACFAFGSVSVLSPFLLVEKSDRTNPAVWTIAIFVGVFAAAMGVTLARTGFLEWRLIKEKEGESEPPAKDKKSPITRVD